MSEDLAALLDHLGVGEVILGGISMGAALTAAFCRRWPSRVCAAVFIRPAWLDKPHPPSLRCLELIGHLMTAYELPEARKRFLQTQEYESLQNISALAAAQCLAIFDEPNAREHGARLVHIPASDAISDWHQLDVCTMPALVVGSENDPFHPLETARQWASYLPHASLSVITSAIENPLHHANQLQYVVLEFLRTLQPRLGPERVTSCSPRLSDAM
jgi:pimeloyl-ACP methyl ester carboxylesterase